MVSCKIVFVGFVCIREISMFMSMFSSTASYNWKFCSHYRFLAYIFIFVMWLYDLLVKSQYENTSCQFGTSVLKCMTRVVQVVIINHVKSNPICDDLCNKILVYIVHRIYKSLSQQDPFNMEYLMYYQTASNLRKKLTMLQTRIIADAKISWDEDVAISI